MPADPTMPRRPPQNVLRAIERLRSVRRWEAIDMYLEIREALEAPEPDPEPLTAFRGPSPVSGI